MYSEKENAIRRESIFSLRGVGKQVAKHLARLSITSIEDLLFHFPSRYQDRTTLQAIAQLVLDEEAVVEGVITRVIIPGRGRTKLLCELHDGTGLLYLRFFHVLSFQTSILKEGVRLRCYGIVRLGQKGREMFHPELQRQIPGQALPIDTCLTPIYPATEGLSQTILRKLTEQALQWMETQSAFEERIPAKLIQPISSLSFKAALRLVHRPLQAISMQMLLENKTEAQQRLIFEELLAHRLSLLQLKHHFQLQKGTKLLTQADWLQRFYAQLPFQLTAAQQRVWQEVQADLQQSRPMLRLVQGDVGSGKTVIAALALLQTIVNGYQAVLMAPTELLAEQHYRTLKTWFEPLGIRIVFLSGQIKATARSSILKIIETGEAQIAIGTHALFQQAVHFAKLALIIIDEQHRFGVEQRMLLREKAAQTGQYPHQLMMTATPIPRTLAMSFYADLDCSTIDELPPGRMPVVTRVISSARREEVMARIHHAIEQGRQVYWVCPLIDISDSLRCQAAIKTAEILQHAFSHFKIGLIHGRMRALEKEKTMRAFQAGEIHILVATTVIEVGVDVPNASVMIIENAERLGLSQLHQLRGRVGRGAVESHCLLLYQYLSPLANERLKRMREISDGFQIAQHDLELRGPGEMLGMRQTGEIAFCIADLLRDRDLLPAVCEVADQLMRDDPAQIMPIVRRWIAEQQHDGKI